VKLLRLGLLLALLAVLLFSATPVYADTPDPDSPPTLVKTDVYQNSIETGDMLFLIYANIPYATTPNTSVTETFIWRLMDTDNVTELGSTVGCNFNDDGYGYNVYSMYFNADNVTGLGIVWGTHYTLRLSGNPAVFDTPPVYNFVINASDYSPAVTKADVQAALAARIMYLANDLDNKWGLSPSYSLVTQNETATVLSIYGEAFFRCAINGVQSMAPAIFSVVIRTIDIDPRDWDPEYAENVTAQYSGTWAETAKEAGAALFGTTYDLLSVIMLLAMSAGLLIGNIMITGDHWNGLVDVAILGVIGARLGMYDMAFLILVAAICWIYIGLKIWFGMIK